MWRQIAALGKCCGAARKSRAAWNKDRFRFLMEADMTAGDCRQMALRQPARPVANTGVPSV